MLEECPDCMLKGLRLLLIAIIHQIILHFSSKCEDRKEDCLTFSLLLKLTPIPP